MFGRDTSRYSEGVGTSISYQSFRYSGNGRQLEIAEKAKMAEKQPEKLLFKKPENGLKWLENGQK